MDARVGPVHDESEAGVYWPTGANCSYRLAAARCFGVTWMMRLVALWWISRLPSRVAPPVPPDPGIDTARRDRPALEGLGLGIEADQRIRPHARLVVPDGPVHDDDAIGMRLRAAGGWPFLDLPGLRIVAAELAATRIDVPNHAVFGDVEAPHRRAGERQFDFRERHVGGIDLEQARMAVAREPRGALGIDLDAVRLRIRDRQRDEFDVAGLRIETADHVRELQREPHDALLVEHHRVRVSRGRVGHLVDGDLAGPRINLADRSVLVARVPGDTLGIELHRMRHGVGRQRVFFHLAGFGIEPPDQVAELAGPPDGPVGPLDRIARALTERRRLPFLERDLDAAGHELGGALGVGREMRRQIIDDAGALLRRARQIDHRADELAPVLARVA